VESATRSNACTKGGRIGALSSILENNLHQGGRKYFYILGWEGYREGISGQENLIAVGKEQRESASEKKVSPLKRGRGEGKNCYPLPGVKGAGSSWGPPYIPMGKKKRKNFFKSIGGGEKGPGGGPTGFFGGKKEARWLAGGGRKKKGGAKTWPAGEKRGEGGQISVGKGEWKKGHSKKGLSIRGEGELSLEMISNPQKRRKVCLLRAPDITRKRRLSNSARRKKTRLFGRKRVWGVAGRRRNEMSPRGKKVKAR